MTEETRRSHATVLLVARLKRDQIELIGAVEILVDMLQQYVQYGEQMRAIGRGFSASGPFSPDYVIAIAQEAIDHAKRQSESVL